MMRVLYVTANVLGASGANAAELFPRIASVGGALNYVGVADFPENKKFITEHHFSDYIRLRRSKNVFMRMLRSAVRIARVSKQKNVDVIHVFYRQENALLCIFLRLALIAFWAKAVVLMDHRSVNLARGWRGFWKKLQNFIAQSFVHHLAGNLWAVETNYWAVWKPTHIIDLGYDTLPPGGPVSTGAERPVNIWFIGSLRPKNRKSEFLVKIFDSIQRKAAGQNIHIHVAGPAHTKQVHALVSNPLVTYYGKVPRADLYELLRKKPGIGVAFMNEEFHGYAPSLKFVEYAAMRYHIVASDTLGLTTQAKRLGLKDVVFASENSEEWADKILEIMGKRQGLAEKWHDAGKWSYQSIFERQVSPLYESIKRG